MESDLEDKVWVSEYLETIFSSKEKPSPAIIWDKVSKFGGKLYKYYSFEDKYSIENLKNGFVHFSKPEKFNDPFDCAVSISLDKIIEAYLPVLIDREIYELYYVDEHTQVEIAEEIGKTQSYVAKHLAKIEDVLSGSAESDEAKANAQWEKFLDKFLADDDEDILWDMFRN